MKKRTELLKNILCDDFDLENKYKLYRTAYEIIHPTISKKNISNYKIIINDSLVPLRVFYPEKISELTSVIIYIHGGGWITGSVNSYSKIIREISKRTGKLVVAIDYRLAPEYKFPIGLNDCYSAVKYLYREFEKLSINNENITIMGDSAGGNLAVSVALKARKTQEINIQKQVLIYPALSGEYHGDTKYESLIKNSELDILTVKHLDSFMKLYTNTKKDLDNPLVAPLKETDFTNMPETLVVTGDIDPLRDEGKEYYKRLKKANVRAKYLNIKFASHGFLNGKDEEIKDEFYQTVIKFLK